MRVSKHLYFGFLLGIGYSKNSLVIALPFVIIGVSRKERRNQLKIK